MIKKLNSYFFGVEENESVGFDGALFYVATFVSFAVALLLKVYTSIG